MASFWEIRDPSNLTYAAERPDAKTRGDSGLGPPSDWYGWVRTGGDSSGSAVAGTGNCLTWSSVNASDSGVAVRLRRSWETPPLEVGGLWDATSFACTTHGPVWCISDLPTGIFFDGFESAGTSFWSTTVP